ncbi:MAG: carbonic anhydrase [Polyangiaceae bacterium]|jgi:carbonic anhydrase|nr:carbonic anhydrase [Polyangiaceae bacterium]
MSSSIVPPLDALTRLREGNARFVANVRSVDALASLSRRIDPAVHPSPFAIILGCADSRAPAETIFDQGLGDLFVIRVAGNIVAPSQIGSVEFAAERFGTQLVVVMGHSHCGAISATVDSMRPDQPPASRNLLSITDRIAPVVAPLMHTELARNRPALLRAATRANVAASASHLRHGSRLLEELILNRGLVVVGAEYDLETGVVDFFDGMN